MAAAAASRAPLFLLEGSRVKETKALIPKFYRLPWVSGVRKEMSVFPWPYKPPKCWDCSPLFLKSQAYPKIIAVLVGKVVDDSRLSAKMQRVLGGHRYSEVTAKAGASSGGIQQPRRCIVLDIEGTTTPISFVTDVLFPYARDNVRKHLELTYDTAEAQDDIKLLRAQVQEDLANNVIGAVHIPSDGDREEVIATVVANVEAMIKADRKITSLKQLQGHIWRTGFQNNEIETVVYDDVPKALEKWHAIGLKVYIYSSGSRLAQRLLFGNTSYGDLRKYLCGFFDTTIGNKKETKSYVEIAESLGVDYPSAILFVTDVYEEATAAKAAGLEVMISIRPGNGPLPENHGFQTINSFSEI